MEVEELNNFHQFHDMRNTWNSLLQRSRDNDIFSTWEWLSSWWRHFGQGRKLRILVIRDEGKIIAIAPLMCARYSFFLFGNLTKLELIGSPQSDYNNLVLIEKESECLTLFLNHLISEYTDWDYLELRDLAENATAVDLLQNTPKNMLSGLQLEKRAITMCPYISLPNSTEMFLKRLKGDMRRSLRRRMRRLNEKHQVKVKTQTDFNSTEEAMYAFFELHQKRWRTKGETGVFAQKTLRDFHVDVAESFAKRGWLNLYFLTADDEPIATIYTFNYRQKSYEYLTGFDPEYSRYSVANLLRMHVVEDCIQKGSNEYDLMRGYEPYKGKWSRESRKNMEIRLIRKGAFARIYGWATKSNMINPLVQKLGTYRSLK